MRGRFWVCCGAVSGGLGVMFGAFGAHLLTEYVTPERLETWEIGVRYQLVHAVALILVGLFCDRAQSRWGTAAGWLFVAGQLIFSGLLYLLVLTDVRILGAIVPIGGLALMAGWACFAVAGATAQAAGGK